MSDADRRRWNDRWRTDGPSWSGSGVVDLLAPWLPPAGRALDIAGGGSNDSIDLARQGLDVTVVDISEVGLAQARDRAADAGLTVATEVVDLDVDPLPDGPWDVVAIANHLDRAVLAGVHSVVADHGLLGIVVATRTNLERHRRPPARFLVDAGELPGLVHPTLQVLHHDETWRSNGRHEAHLVARRG